MKKDKQTVLAQRAHEFFADLDLGNCPNDYIDWDNDVDFDTVDFDEIESMLSGTDFFTIEVIYYDVAMEYLMENDTSLKTSLALASDIGYTLDSEYLGSELLASLLKTENFREEFSDLEDEINYFFDDLRDEFEDYDEDEEDGDEECLKKKNQGF